MSGRGIASVRNHEIIRMAAAGLQVPGWGQGQIEALYKAESARVASLATLSNRASYFSDAFESSMLVGDGAENKPPSQVAFTVLRRKFQQSPIDKLIVLRRTAQMRRVAQRCVVPGKTVGYRVVHERYQDPNFSLTPETQKRCDEMERLIGRVSREIHSGVKQFDATAVKEELTIDRKVMLKFLNSAGKPVSYNLVDGATIHPRIEVLMPWMLLHGYSNIDLAAEAMSGELYAAGVRDDNGKPIDMTQAAWVQTIDEVVRGAWTTAEMDVDITNREIELDQVFYGRSALEQSLEITDSFINAWSYNSSLFDARYPERVVIAKGNLSPVALANFKRTVLQQDTVAGPHRLPVLDGSDKDFDFDVKQLRDTPKDALYTELMRITICLKTAAYCMHPSEINFSTDGGGKSGDEGSDEKSEELAIEHASEDGFLSMLDNMAAWKTAALIQPHYDDLVMVYDGLKIENEQAAIEIRTKKLAADTSIEESRAANNLDKLELDDDISKWDLTKIPMNPTLAQFAQLKTTVKQQADQMEMQKQQMAQQAQAGGPGGPGGPGGEDGQEGPPADERGPGLHEMGAQDDADAGLPAQAAPTGPATPWLQKSRAPKPEPKPKPERRDVYLRVYVHREDTPS